MPLEKKGVDVVQVDSFVRLILTANDEWVVPATSDERRYAVFEVPDTRKDDTAYWDSLYRQIGNDGLAGFLAYLLAWQVPEGVDVRRPPQTAGLARQKVAGLRNVERWWFGLLSIGELQDCEHGRPPRRRRGDWGRTVPGLSAKDRAAPAMMKSGFGASGSQGRLAPRAPSQEN